MVRQSGIQDLDLLFSIQRETSLAGVAHIFPPELYPYPDEDVRRGLRDVLQGDEVAVIIDDDGRGFAVTQPGWLQRLYVRERAWGTGVADELHTASLATLRAQGASSASLWCLAENARARRFYEKRGWCPNGSDRVVPFPPHPLDVGYSLQL